MDRELDLANPDTYAEGYPHAYFRQLRQTDPVHWNPPGEPDCSTIGPHVNGHWAITKHADVVSLSRAPRQLSNAAGSIFVADLPPEQLAAMGLMLINMDPPIHTKQRRILQPGFTPKMVKLLEPRIVRHTKRVVDAVASKGRCEFVRDLAVEMPLIVICELMGIPEQDGSRVFRWANEMVGTDDPEVTTPEKTMASNVAAYTYARELAERRRAEPDDSLMSDFLHRGFEGRTVTEDEIAAFFVLLLAAGTETTQTATANAMLLLSRHPDQKQLLLSNLDRHLESAVEEILRFEPPVVAMRRTAVEDLEVRGKKIARGDKVVFYYAAANRDEDVFENPDVFDITRNPNPHLSFGIGQHFCLGANLARMQLRCVLREVLARLPDIEISGPISRRRSNLVNAFNRMPVAFTPE